MAEHKKPLGIVLLTIFSFALALLLIIVPLYVLITDSCAIKDNIQLFISLPVVSAVAISVIMAALFLLVGFCLWFLRGLAKTILLVLSGLGIVVFPLKGLMVASTMGGEGKEIAASEIIGVVSAVIGVFLSLVILYYLSRPNVILEFEAKEMALVKKKIRSIEEKIEVGRKQCGSGMITKAELAKLKSDCIAEERLLRGRIRHLEKVRLSRERMIKDAKTKKKEAKEEKQKKKEEKMEKKEEKKAERQAKKEEEKEKEKPEEEGKKVEKKPKKEERKPSIEDEKQKKEKPGKKEAKSGEIRKKKPKADEEESKTKGEKKKKEKPGKKKPKVDEEKSKTEGEKKKKKPKNEKK